MDLSTFSFYCFIFSFGAIFGSFYACLVQRYVFMASLFARRSSCMICGKTLSALNLIPLFSYIIQRGRCSYCHEKISSFYACIEFLTACIACFIYKKYGFSLEGLFFFAVSGVLIVLSFIDVQTMLIPDLCSIGAFVFFVPIGLFWDVLPLWSSILGSLLAGGIAFLLYAYYLWVRKIHALGLGDVKLLFFLGALVGIYDVPYLFLYSSLTALFVFFVYYCFLRFRSYSFIARIEQYLTKGKEYNSKKTIRETPIPFGPFLAFASLLIFL